jgi:hypothetical protein
MKKTLLKLSSCLAMFGLISGVNAQTRYLDEVFTDSEVTVTSNVVYGSNYSVITGSPVLGDLFMDIYEPTQSADNVTARPVIVYLHTGNFLPPTVNGGPTGSKADSTVVELARQWAKRGYVVAVPNYRLGWNPVATDEEVRRSTLLVAVYRAIIDTKTAVRFLRKEEAVNSNPYKIDGSKVVLFGQGSGGYVALAYGSLNKVSETQLPKFTWADPGPNGEPVGSPYLNFSLWGDLDGYGGMFNEDNHTGYSASVNMVANIGGSLADTSWLEAGEPAVVSFQAVRDPFAPYGNGTVIVPTNQNDVVDVSGAGVFMSKVVALGNNSAFATWNFNDPYTLAARSKYNKTYSYFLPAPFNNINSGNGEGLFPIVRDLASTRFANISSPWEWQGSATVTEASAMTFLDTINGYLHPRIMRVLQLPGYLTISSNLEIAKSDLSIYPNPAKNLFNIVADSYDNAIKEIRIFDIAGRLHFDKMNMNELQQQVDASQFPSGVYFVNVVTKKENKVHKVVIQ